jgi:hypothetical protein
MQQGSKASLAIVTNSGGSTRPAQMRHTELYY